MKLALVHDWLKEIGGAERVLIELHRIFPEAPIYTLFYDEKFVREWLPGADIRASFLQKIPFITKIYPAFGWLMPAVVESFDLSDFDRVLSSSVTFSKGLVLKPATKHICYCYSPTRYLWDWQSEYSKNRSWFGKVYQHFMRLWDRAAADRVDEFIAISKNVQSRIKKYYGRDSIVIYPSVRQIAILDPLPTGQAFHSLSPSQLTSHWPSPADFSQPIISADSANVSNVSNRQSASHTESYYLIVSRLFPHKNIGVAIQAFNKLGYPLVIIGDGPIRNRLERKAGKNIKFLGNLSDQEIAAWYSGCRAFVMPQEEDFGLTAVEAMSFGKPVVALRRGGATETVVAGETGEFFEDPIPEALADAVRRLNEHYASFSPDKIKSHAAQFSSERFEKEIREVLA